MLKYTLTQILKRGRGKKYQFLSYTREQKEKESSLRREKTENV